MTEFARVDPEIPDSELVERGRSGDEAALGALVRRHQDTAYRVALSITRNEDTAFDVVQGAFLKAFLALDGFRGDASFRTWLGTIVANEARGALRTSKRRRESALDDAGSVSSDEKNAAEAVEIADESSRARKMMESLPEKQRLSVALRIEEGLSFREIGEMIGSSEGAARVNYFHGIRRLRELMQ